MLSEQSSKGVGALLLIGVAVATYYGHVVGFVVSLIAAYAIAGILKRVGVLYNKDEKETE